jgi:ABC-type glycerol-3-phosphate transport system substrate-binding protein
LGNNPPDILLDGLDRRIMKYVQFGKSEEVSDLIKDDLKDYNKNTLDVLTKDGKLYGIPISMNPQHMFINRKIFRDKGLESLIPENRDWTFPQWRDAMKKVSGNGVYGSAIFAGNEQGDELPMLYMFGNGAEQWNNESSEVVLGQYKEAAEVLQMFKDMVKEGSLAPGPASLKSLDVLEMFKQGKLAMIARGEDLYATIENGKKDGSANKDIELYGMKPVHKEGVKPKYSFSVTGYTLFKQDDPDKREMVKKLIKMMTAPENTKLLAQSGGYIPARSSSSYETENKDKSAMMKLIAELPGANIGTRSPYYSDVRAFWFPSFQAALLDNMTPEQAIKDYTDKANKLIKDKSSKK